MRSQSARTAWIQGVSTAAVAAAIAIPLWVRLQRPFDRDTLSIQVSQLHSDAAEARTLMENAASGRLAPWFVREHARQLADKVTGTGRKLGSTAAGNGLSEAHERAQQLGLSLHATLQSGSQLRAAELAARFARLSGQLEGLEQQLKPGG